MADSALYYPYIDVPESPSLLRVLLYWDTLGSLIPEGAVVKPWTRELIASGLVEPIRPSRYVDASTLVADVDCLLDADLLRPSLAPPFFLHIEKTNRWMLELLRERGLATWAPDVRPDRPGKGWIAVDGNIGALYVAYLVSYICAHGGLDMEPITDQEVNFEALAGSGSLSTATGLDRLRAATLDQVLPTPISDVPIIELVDFKDKHRELLRELRRETESHVLDCARERDPEIRRRMCGQFSRELADRARETERRMSERRWSIRRGVIALIAGGAAAASPIAGGQPEVAVATGAAPLLIDWLRSRFSGTNLDSAAMYAVLAQRRFGSTGDDQ
jgi:hypothetical protein